MAHGVDDVMMLMLLMLLLAYNSYSETKIMQKQ